MRTQDLRLAALSAAIVSCIPFGASAQLEEIIVTATRRETDLQSTPLSIQAFTVGAARARRHHERPRPRHHGAERRAQSVHRRRSGRLPRSRIARRRPLRRRRVAGRLRLPADELHRVRARRGVARPARDVVRPQYQRRRGQHDDASRPGDEFGARVKLDVGDFNRRDVQLAVDVPLTDNLKTKFIAATFKNDGFIEGLTTPWDFGSQDDTILRGDVLLTPTDNFSLRVTYNDEQKRGTDPKVHRMTRYDGSRVYAYNVMLGVFQDAANAACAADPARCLAVGASGAASRSAPSLRAAERRAPISPVLAARLGYRLRSIGIGTRYTGQAPAAYNPATHTTNYPDGFLGAPDQQLPHRAHSEHQLRSRSGRQVADEVRLDGGRHHGRSRSTPPLTARWDITDNLNFEAILSNWEQDQRQVIDFDGTEFLVTTDDLSTARERHDGVPSVGHGAERAHQLARRLLLARRGDQDPRRSLGHVRVGHPRRTQPSPQTAFPCNRASTWRLPSTCDRPLRCSV